MWIKIKDKIPPMGEHTRNGIKVVSSADLQFLNPVGTGYAMGTSEIVAYNLDGSLMTVKPKMWRVG